MMEIADCGQSIAITVPCYHTVATINHARCVVLASQGPEMTDQPHGEYRAQAKYHVDATLCSRSAQIIVS